MNVTHRTFSGLALARACACAATLLLALWPGVARANLPLDAAGWSTLTPSADSHLIYVSSDTGSDTTGTYYLPANALIGPDPFHPVGPIAPFKTAAGAYAKTLDGRPDWILFHRGETWTTGLPGCHNGRSDSERMVITSYGSSTTRPQFKTGTAGGLGLLAGSGGRLWVQYIAVVGLHFYCQMRDPSSPDFAGYANGSEGISFLAQDSNGYVGNIRHILIEDCQVEWYGVNLDAQSAATSFLQNLVVRRNVINNAWNTSAHAQGFFSYNTGPITLEENIFDHNGWIMTGNSLQGGATMFNHNTYFSATHDITFRGNMFLQASSIGTKWCTNNGEHTRNIVLDNNLYVEGEIGMQIGGNGTDPYGFSNITVTNNVFEAQGRAQPTGRGTLGWGIWEWDWDGGVIQHNTFVHQDTLTGANVFAITLQGGSNRNVQVLNNRVYGLYSPSALISLTDSTSYSSMTLASNIVDTGTYNTPIASITGSIANYHLSGNRYYTTRTANQWFQVAGANKNFAQWKAVAGESGTTTGSLPYIEPTRSAETYNATQGGPGTFADFVAQAKLQSKANWRTAYTAAAVNTYIRNGFDQAPVAHSDSYGTSESVALTCTAPGVLVNDTDADGDVLSASLVTSATHGSVTLNADGSFVYNPAPNYSGKDRFVYRAYDGVAYSGNTTVTLTVNWVDRPPAFAGNPIAKPAAVAGVAYDGSIAGDASDPDTTDTLTFSKRGGPAWLSVASGGALSGIPTKADVGLSSFTVRVTDTTGLSADATLEIPVVDVSQPWPVPALLLY